MKSSLLVLGSILLAETTTAGLHLSLIDEEDPPATAAAA